MKTRAACIAMSAALLAPGCLIGEVAHTLFLDPDGAVLWVVEERETRSDLEGPDGRREERDYLDRAWAGEQPVAMALEWLDPMEMEVEVTRGERPFTVVSKAWFPGVERLAEEFLAGMGVAGSVRLVASDSTVTLEIAVATEVDGGDAPGSADVLAALAADGEDYRIVLTYGRFTDADGFELSRDGVVAVPDEDACEDSGEMCTLSLTWTRG